MTEQFCEVVRSTEDYSSVCSSGMCALGIIVIISKLRLYVMKQPAQRVSAGAWWCAVTGSNPQLSIFFYYSHCYFTIYFNCKDTYLSFET